MNCLRQPAGTVLTLAALAAAIVGTVLGAPWSPGEPAAPFEGCRPERPAVAERVARIGMTVSDLSRAIEFYTTVLGFERVEELESSGNGVEHLTGVFGASCRTVRLRLGSDVLELTQFLAPQGKPLPADSRSNDGWFQHIALAVSDMERAYAHLRAHHVRQVSSEPQKLPAWNPAAGGIEAFYFTDPDGHVLELIHFPPGKGDPKWQGRTDRLVLGIDHTAIVVHDTERSLAFYRGALGLVVAGTSENYGPEQEHLNNVFGARLRITGLRSAAGPGVELLEYLAPGGGRDYPGDARPCDQLHWQTTMVVNDAEGAAGAARRGGGSWISAGVIDGVEGIVDAHRAVLVRDPDGHAVLMVQGQTDPAR